MYYKIEFNNLIKIIVYDSSFLKVKKKLWNILLKQDEKFFVLGLKKRKVDM